MKIRSVESAITTRPRLCSDALFSSGPCAVRVSFQLSYDGDSAPTVVAGRHRMENDQTEGNRDQ